MARWDRATAAISVLLSGCSVLIDPASVAMRCEIGLNGDPCVPLGLVCTAGECAAPTTDDTSGICRAESVELCDGVDNDCDGEIDEDADADGDGFTWCGGGHRELADCDDNNANTHPADTTQGMLPADEVCDEKDNDCDGSIDETSIEAPACPLGHECIHGACIPSLDCNHGETCPPGQRCALERHPAVCLPGDCRVDGCEANEYCDVASRSCVAFLDLGEPCRRDDECMSTRCFPAASLDLGAAAFAVGVCSAACGTDADCGEGRICWGSGTGARGCLSPTRLSREVGPEPAGAACALDRDCVSSVCASGICVGACAGDADCAAAHHCSLVGPYSRGSVDGLMQLACSSTAGVEPAWESCHESSECASGLCAGVLGVSFCTQACRTSKDCEPAFFFETFCGVLAVRRSGSTRTDYVQICLPSTHDGNGVTGNPCVSSDECADRTCVAGSCAGTCAIDEDCPVYTACRPTPTSAGWPMRCVAD